MESSDEVDYDEESTDAGSTEVDAEDSEWVPNEDEVEDTESGMEDVCDEEDDDITESEVEEEDDEKDSDWDTVDAEDDGDYEADGEDSEQDDDWIGDAAEEDDDDYQAEDMEDEDDDYYEEHDEYQDEDLPLKKKRCVHQDGVHEMATVMHEKPPCDNQGSNGKEIMDKSGSSDEGNHEESFDTEGTEDP
jgi:hypothetical protein